MDNKLRTYSSISDPIHPSPRQPCTSETPVAVFSRAQDSFLWGKFLLALTMLCSIAACVVLLHHGLHPHACFPGCGETCGLWSALPPSRCQGSCSRRQGLSYPFPFPRRVRGLELLLASALDLGFLNVSYESGP